MRECEMIWKCTSGLISTALKVFPLYCADKMESAAGEGEVEAGKRTIPTTDPVKGQSVYNHSIHNSSTTHQSSLVR